MDTLGTITPQAAGMAEAEHRTEALERLRYLAHSGTSGLISGLPGTGKTRCLTELARQLRREGKAVAQISLAGVTGTEFPWLLSQILGSGLSSSSDPIDCWQWLHDYSAACRSSHRQLVLLVDQVEYADENVIISLRRMMDGFERNCAWIFAARNTLSPVWKAFLHEQVWLRVELQPLTGREARQVLSREMLQHGSPARFTAEGGEAAQQIAQGRIRRLQQLAELAALASSLEGVTEIDAEMVQAMAEEVV